MVYTCRRCKYLNRHFTKYVQGFGYALGFCMKKRNFVFTDVAPCKHFKIKEED